MNILAVIPARGGSKGIPRKNVRLMNGKPLISYAINNAKACNKITDIVITTDDEEIISISKLNNVDYIERDSDLAGDFVTLDPVVYDAVNKMEKKKNKVYDIVITLQPTSPLMKWTTLSSAIDSFISEDKDTYISAVNRPHLSWSKDGYGFYPNYKERLNRQKLPPEYFETGAFFITKRKFLKSNSRMGDNISVYEVPEEESIDIDSTSDWIICENILRKKRIIFRADGYKRLGMGHIYHCLTLAYNLTGHEVMFVLNSKYREGIEKITSSNMPYKLINNDEELFVFIDEWKPDIFINDCLDTEKEYIIKLKNHVNRIITIEDMGEGAEYADAVINALYNEQSHKHSKYKENKNMHSGQEYVCLRDEFLVNQPKCFSNEVRNVLVMFGGTDPSNLNKKLYDIFTQIYNLYPDIKFYFITGSGYDCVENNIITDENKNIYVLNDIKRVSDYMRESDIAFTSQGRTVYELASLGVPSIVLAQNQREQLHTFAQMQNGFLNLGLGKDISSETLKFTFKWLIQTVQIRLEMRELMLKNDLKKGIKNVIDIILKE